MLLKLEVFQYATPINLNTVYYHIPITEVSSNPSTIIIPWGKFHYKRLPMGDINSPGVFQ